MILVGRATCGAPSGRIPAGVGSQAGRPWAIVPDRFAVQGEALAPAQSIMKHANVGENAWIWKLYPEPRDAEKGFSSRLVRFPAELERHPYRVFTLNRSLMVPSTRN